MYIYIYTVQIIIYIYTNECGCSLLKSCWVFKCTLEKIWVKFDHFSCLVLPLAFVRFIFTGSYFIWRHSTSPSNKHILIGGFNQSEKKQSTRSLRKFGRKMTLPETNVAPENQWLENEISFWDAYFQGRIPSQFSLPLWKIPVQFSFMLFRRWVHTVDLHLGLTHLLGNRSGLGWVPGSRGFGNDWNLQEGAPGP